MQRRTCNLNPYEVLGVKPGASDEEIKRAYREMAKKNHPDQFRNTPQYEQALEKMKEINAAYDALTGKNVDGFGNGGSYSGANGAGTGAGGDPSFVQVRAYMRAGMLAQAESMLNAMSDRPAEWYYLMGAIYMRRGWYTQARDYLKRAHEMEPNNQEYAEIYRQFENQGRGFSGRTFRGNAQQNQMCQFCMCMLAANICCGSSGSLAGWWPMLFCC